MRGDDFFLIPKRPMTDAEAACRAIFLDFDGSRPRPVLYYAAPSEAKLNAESIERIVATLNDVFSDREIQFFTDPPSDGSYQTIYVNDPVSEPTPDPSEVIDVVATEVKPGSTGDDSEREIIDRIAAEAERILKKRGSTPEA